MWQLSNPKFVGWTSRLETYGRAGATLQIWRPLVAEFPLPLERSFFCSVHTINWLDETHPHMESNLLYSNSVSLNVNFIQKHPHRKRIMFDHICGPCGPVKLTCKITITRREVIAPSSSLDPKTTILFNPICHLWCLICVRYYAEYRHLHSTSWPSLGMVNFLTIYFWPFLQHWE